MNMVKSISEPIDQPTGRSVAKPVASSAQGWVWSVVLIAAIAMPWLFYNYTTHRHSGFVVSMLSQMGMMSILALSYNMLLGQAGLFSLCHATFFGIGGYATIHFLSLAGAGNLPLPLELIPFLSGLSGLGLAIVKRFAHDLGGELAIANRVPRGAHVTLSLPAVREDVRHAIAD